MEFQRVFNNCKYRANNRWLTVLAMPNRLDHPRLGLAISRKVAHTAVARNRIKRAVRESFRSHQGRLDALDIVVLGRTGVAGRTGKELATALETLWTRINESCAGPSSN
jgi:ribonuclease P protein component